MKAFINDKETSKLYEQKAASITGVESKFVNEYCFNYAKLIFYDYVGYTFFSPC